MDENHGWLLDSASNRSAKRPPLPRGSSSFGKADLRRPELAEDKANMAERWLTVAGVADHLAVSRDTVESLIRGADLVAVDVSPNYRDRRHRAAWRVSPADLEDFLATRRTGVAATPVTRPARRRPKGDVVEFV